MRDFTALFTVRSTYWPTIGPRAMEKSAFDPRHTREFPRPTFCSASRPYRVAQRKVLPKTGEMNYSLDAATRSFAASLQGLQVFRLGRGLR